MLQVQGCPARARALELFDAFRSTEKTLQANLGGHTGIPWFAAEDAGAVLRAAPHSGEVTRAYGRMAVAPLGPMGFPPVIESGPLLELVRAQSKAQGLAPELREELDRLTLPFSHDATPSDAELRIAQAQLVGWLEGLFHGIQTALFAQQMAARAQLEQMRQLPPGMAPQGQRGPTHPGTGQYL